VYKANKTQLRIRENLLHNNLPKDTLYQIDKLIDWQPFEKILAKFHLSKVGRSAYNPLKMLKILIIQQIYGHSDPEIEMMLYGNNFYSRFVRLSATDPVPDHSTFCRFRKALDFLTVFAYNVVKLKGYEIKRSTMVVV